MSSYQLNRRTALIAEKAELEAALILAKAAYTGGITNSEVESYKFDSGEGSQQTKRRSLKEIRKEIAYLKAQLAHVINELAGVGVQKVKLRRNRGGNGSRIC